MVTIIPAQPNTWLVTFSLSETFDGDFTSAIHGNVAYRQNAVVAWRVEYDGESDVTDAAPVTLNCMHDSGEAYVLTGGSVVEWRGHAFSLIEAKRHWLAAYKRDMAEE